MGKLIDADALLDVLKNKYSDFVAGAYPFNVVVYDVVRIIENQPALPAGPKWISVKDRLPENEETVLISAVRKCANGKHWNVVMTAFYTDGKLHTEDSSFAWDSDCVEMEYCEETDDYIIPEGWWEAVECGDEFSAVDLFVTHWIPLPEPPKEE